MDNIRDNIWIGNEFDIVNIQGLDRNKINIVFICAREITYGPISKVVIHCPLYEETYLKNDFKLIKAGLLILRKLYSTTENILVGCLSGQNRSVCMVSGLIALVDNTNFENALKFVEYKRNIANPTQKLIDEVKSAIGLLRR